MDFRQKIEAAILPLLDQLRAEITKLRTADLLNHYQFRLNLSQLNSDKLPDGFWAKGRYVSALALAGPFVEGPSAEAKATFARIDDIVERIYDTYGFGAVYDRGNVPGSETEFLTRLGLAIRVRESDALGFPEQFRAWATARLQPFNNRYFVPTLGLTFEEISGWPQNLSDVLEKRLNGVVEGLRQIAEGMDAVRRHLVSGDLSIEAARGEQRELVQRLDANARAGGAAHMFTFEEIKGDIVEASAKKLLSTFGIKFGEAPRDFKFR